MSATLDRGGPLLAGCLTPVTIRRDAHSDAPGDAPPGPVVHVWRADLDAVPDELVDLLSPEERARATRIVREPARARWASSRGVLRALLGRYLERPPGALRFQTGPHGKPALPEGELLSFNVSHSAGLALYVLARGAPVGVDVELLAPRTPRDEVALAERVLGPDAAQRLRALPPSARHREFLRQWVRHEAALKCLGIGLLDEAAPTSSLAVIDLDVGPHAAAALAVQAAPPEAAPVGASPSGPLPAFASPPRGPRGPALPALSLLFQPL